MMGDHKEVTLVPTGPLRHIYIRSSEGYLYNNDGQVGFGVLKEEDPRFHFDLLSYSGYIMGNGGPTKAGVYLISHSQDVPVGFPPLFLCANTDHTVTLKEGPVLMLSLPDGDSIKLPATPCDGTQFCLQEALFIFTNVNKTNGLQWNHFVFLESLMYKEYYVRSQDRSLSLEKCSEDELPFRNDLKFDLLDKTACISTIA